MTYDDDTDRGWWLPPLVFGAWLGAVAIATVELGVLAGVLAWLGVPLVIAGGLVVWNAVDNARRRAARRRHPAGSDLERLGG
jgi:hypothetical protein